MMLTKRQKELLDCLLNQSDFQTVAYFANKLGVSKRTTHLELEVIKEYLQQTEQFLKKKRGVGILLQKKNEEISLKPDKEGRDLYSKEYRRIEIMNLLLLKNEDVSFNKLSELFMVSKSSIIKDLEHIMDILNTGSAVCLSSDVYGTRLVGEEEEFQKALLQYNRFLIGHFDHELTEKDSLLADYYGERVTNVCSNILYMYVRENIQVISDYYVQNILSIFIILVYRIKQDRHIQNKKPQLLTDEDSFFEESAVRMLHKAALRLEFSYTNEDVQYLSQHLVANRFEILPIEKTNIGLVEDLLTRVSDSLKIDFSIDKQLERQLRSHIPPMIYRLKSHNRIENPFTNQIKNEFSLTFNVISVVIREYGEEFRINFNEDEIAFLTMYFQAAIERAKMNRKILVVCQMGIATSELLINRIKSVLPSLDLLEVASVAELASLKIKEYDMIISTVKLKIPEKVIVVSPFLTEEDIQKIKKSGYRPQKVSKVVSLSKGIHLQRFLKPEFMYINSNFSSKKELIQQVGEDLIRENYVEPAYIENVLEREVLGGTDLPSGTAVPHGNMAYVNQTVIVAVKNQKKFKWCKYHVDLIFFICIAKQDKSQTRNILADIYNIIDDQQQLKLLRKTNTVTEFYQEIGSERCGESQ